MSLYVSGGDTSIGTIRIRRRHIHWDDTSLAAIFLFFRVVNVNYHELTLRKVCLKCDKLILRTNAF